MIEPVSFSIFNTITKNIDFNKFNISNNSSHLEIVNIQKDLYQYQIQIELLTKGIDAFTSTVKRLSNSQ